MASFMRIFVSFIDSVFRVLGENTYSRTIMVPFFYIVKILIETVSRISGLGSMTLISRYHKGPTPLPPMVPDAAIDALETFQYRDDDILIATFSKSGTHWINEVVQLILHGGDPTELDHRHRRVCLEIKDTLVLARLPQVKSSIELVDTDPSPRVLTTHLPPCYLSEETWTKRIPIVVVLRDPRDCALSFWAFAKDFMLWEGVPAPVTQTFDQFLKDFIDGNVFFGGWCEHVLSYEEGLKKGENILFITYEDMKKDLSAVIKAVSKHIGREVTDDVIQKIIDNTSKEAMMKNYKEATKKKDKVNADLSVFIKTGVKSKWKPEQAENQWDKLDKVFKEKVKNSLFAKQYFEY